MGNDTTPTYRQLAFWTVPGIAWTIIGAFGTGPGNGLVFVALGIICLLAVLFYAVRRRKHDRDSKGTS
ncbi:LPXTG cell wall anchor domain-containing protein [Amycolatopsis oliviviridis]|uniref:LPXTG cell wall anchor domain-containing protein n=1 Tax=Amycolatopsis oliviviridis TaxID=1471590 RepID=UPI00174AE7C8